MMSMLGVTSVLAQGANSPVSQSGGGGNGFLIWAVVLLAVAVALFVIEMFIPSGGLIGILAAAAAVGGIVLMFWQNTTLGIVTLVVALAALPFAVGLALAVWPNTWFAQILTLKSSQRPLTTAGGTTRGDEDAETDAADAEGEAGAETGPRIGERGRTVGELRPVGTCVIGGRRLECLASRGVIESGVEVEVVSVDGMQVKVRPVEAGRRV